MTEIPHEYRGRWPIIEKSQWVNDGLDIQGPALLSLTGYADRLRMHALLRDRDADRGRTTAIVPNARESANQRPSR